MSKIRMTEKEFHAVVHRIIGELTENEATTAVELGVAYSNCDNATGARLLNKLQGMIEHRECVESYLDCSIVESGVADYIC